MDLATEKNITPIAGLTIDLTLNKSVLSVILKIAAEILKHPSLFVDSKTKKHIDVLTFLKKLKVHPLYIKENKYKEIVNCVNSEYAKHCYKLFELRIK